MSKNLIIIVIVAAVLIIGTVVYTQITAPPTTSPVNAPIESQTTTSPTDVPIESSSTSSFTSASSTYTIEELLEMGTVTEKDGDVFFESKACETDDDCGCLEYYPCGCSNKEFLPMDEPAEWMCHTSCSILSKPKCVCRDNLCQDSN